MLLELALAFLLTGLSWGFGYVVGRVLLRREAQERKRLEAEYEERRRRGPYVDDIARNGDGTVRVIRRLRRLNDDEVA